MYGVFQGPLVCRWCDFDSGLVRMERQASEMIRQHAELAHPEEYRAATTRPGKPDERARARDST